MPFFYGDLIYIILVMPFVFLAGLAQSRVKNTFSKYSTMRVRSGITGAQLAERMLADNGIRGVRIERVEGELTDHYDPEVRVIRLSGKVHDSSSCAALGVAAHECGHVIQYATDYAPIRLRTAIIPITQIGSKVSMPLIILGFLLASFAPKMIILSYIGLILFGTVALFQIFTLPAEFDASRRAVQSLQGMGIMTPIELDGAKKVLNAAALTYLAALAVTLMQILRLFLILMDRDRRN